MPAATKSARGFHALSVRSVRRLTREALEITFDVPPEVAERFRFDAGQFVTLEALIDGETVRRSYSICAAPAQAELRVAIKRVSDGRFSTWAHEALVPGARIAVAPPDGRFGTPLDPANDKHYLAVAAGSGITPVVSLVRAILETEPRSRVTLVYGNRASSAVMFRDDLQDLKDRYLERLALLFVMSREATDVALLAGRIDEEKMDRLFETWIDPATVDVAFVCGPQAMTQAVVASLGAHGVAPEAIKTELFAPGPRTASRPCVGTEQSMSSIPAFALMDGRRQSFEIERGRETILEAGLRQGIDLPYSCKGGVCSTCRVMLVEGDVDMDVHYALEDYEIARGFILMCQSYPVSESIGVDVDSHSHA